MATAAAAAVPHQVPPFHLPPVPRVRPPRLLPGDPHPNNAPQPAGLVSEGQVWAQGKWRNQASNAAKQHQHRLSQRVKRALKQHTHGMNIYAYKHIRSSQVVYSLTRNMESGQIMPQLLFHGKKTVPASLRRDVWRPYFSVHFPETPAGVKAGLTSYHRLREFSMRRQLDPPPSHLIATEKDYERAKRGAGDPLEVRERQIKGELKLPMVGQLLPRKLRARKLMDQKASSVADLAFVLTLAQRSLPRLEKELLVPLAERDRKRMKLLGPKGRKRLHAIRREEVEEQKELAERQTIVEKVNFKNGQMPLDRKVATQLSIEYDGAVAGRSNRVINMADIEKAKVGSRDPYEIQVCWADIRDGTYAERWPQGVFHGELQPVVTSKLAEMRIRQHRTVDDDGVVIEEQRGPVTVVTGSSPHIIGRQKGAKYRPFQEDLREKAEKNREAREAEVTRWEGYEERQTIAAMRWKYVKAADEFDRLVSIPNFVSLSDREGRKDYLDPDERDTLAQYRAQQGVLLGKLAPLRDLEVKYPGYAIELDRREYWELHSGPKAKPRFEALLRRRSSQGFEVSITPAQVKVLEEQKVNLDRELNLLKETMKARTAEIDKAKEQFKKEKSPLNNASTTPTSGTTTDIPVADAAALGPTTKSQLLDNLNALRDAQKADSRRLADLQTKAANDFAPFDEQVSKLLPKSYRDPKYWATEDEVEEENEGGAPREEEEGDREGMDAELEEKRGLFSRVGERVRGWVGR